MIEESSLPRLLDRARWAPSGDNTQPWKFEIVGRGHIRVHGEDTREWCVYDLEGRASQMAHGALLETLRIAATELGLKATWNSVSDRPASSPQYDVQLIPSAGEAPDPLARCIEKRTVQRRVMSMQPLTEATRQALVESVGEGYQLQFFETGRDRLRVAALLWANAHIRLTMPEAYATHRRIVEWNAKFSDTRIPEEVAGVDPMTAKLMHWVMGSWQRVEFFNRFLAGTVLPRIQLDVLPALGCAAHVLLRPLAPLKCPEDYVHLGEKMQRLWLTATNCGLQFQPEMTPVIFRWYAREGVTLSRKSKCGERAEKLAKRFERLVGASERDVFGFFCRVGIGASPESRSLRKSVDQLMVPSESASR